MLIRAGAGTGKTTTLRGIAHRNPRSRMLYLAFNRAIKEEATRKFGENVRAMTAHGLAFARIGKEYTNIPNKLASGDLKPYHVAPAIKSSLGKMPASMGNLYGGRVVETLKNFLVSADPEIDEQHLPISAAPAEKKHFLADRLLLDAQKVWECMQDLKDPMPMMHDGYLKMFQLLGPQLNWYDTILLDEAQDTNPVTLAIVQGQTHARQILVGDEHQAIYAFRGAQNAMAIMETEAEFMLTGSFRFGQQIAELANDILRAKGEEKLRLRGLGPRSEVLEKLPHGTSHAFIARGNSALFARAVQAIEDKESFSFVGPLYNYRFDLVEQALNLSLGETGRIKDPFLSGFRNYEELEEYSDALEDREWQGRCRLVQKYGRRIPYLVGQIQRHAGSYPDGGGRPHLILTSAHRSKGLEFDNVVIANDYKDFHDEETGEWVDLENPNTQTIEEVNLMYVAATRAKARLEISEKLMAFRKHYAQQQQINKASRAAP